MNGQADGEIRVDTRIDPDGFERDSAKLKTAVKSLEAQAKQLGQELKSAVKTGSFTEFNEQAERARAEVARLQAELKGLADTPVKTDLYVEYEGMIEKARQALDRLIERQNKLRETGVKENSQQWRNLQYDIDKAKEKIAELHNEMLLMENEGYAFMPGSETAQYTALQQQIEASQQRIALTTQAASAEQRLAEEAARAAEEKRRLAEEAERAKAAAAELAANEKRIKEETRRAKEEAKRHTRALEEQKRGMDGLISKAKRFVFTMMGMRGVYGLLRKAVSSYLENHEDVSARLEASIARLGEALGPLIEMVVNGLTVIVDLITQALALIGITGKSATTAGKEAETGGKKAEKAWKKARDLMGFDDLNRLSDNSKDAEQGQGTGSGEQMGSGLGMEVSPELLRHLGEILATITAIGLALKALKSGSAILQGLAGGLLAVVGGFTEFLGLKSILKDGINWGNVLESILGGGTLIAGAALIGKAFGNTFLGAAIGGIVAGVPMFIVGIIDSIKEGITLKSAAITALGSTLAGAGIGFLVGGPVGALIGAGIGLLTGAITDFTIWLVQNWDSIKEKAAETWSNIKDSVRKKWTEIKTNTVQTWTNIKQTASDIWTGIKEQASSTWESIRETTGSKLTQAKEKAASLWTSIQSKAQETGTRIAATASEQWTEIRTTINEKLSVTRTKAAELWSNMKAKAAETGQSILNAMTSDWTSIKERITGKIEETATRVKQHYSDLKSSLSNFNEQIKSNASQCWENIRSSASSKWTEIKTAISQKWHETMDAIRSTVSEWREIGKDLIDGIKEGIKRAWENLETTVVDLFWDLVDGIKRVFGIHSPSTVMADIFVNVDKGAEVGLESGRKSLLETAEGLAEDVTNAMQPGLPGFDLDGMKRNAADAVSAVAAETSKRFDNGDFMAELGVGSRLDGALDLFSDKIASHFTALMDRLQAIADGMAFKAPTMVNGFVPYAVAAGGPQMGPSGEWLKDYLAENFADILGAMVAGFETMQAETHGLREDVQGIEVGDKTIGEANDRWQNQKAIMRGRR